ncbi:NEDD4-binding protein [Ralstonia phage RSP15]|uniref:ATPase n=1 Tax=Ralstonia phage RSP15 TaxID=1785960 RepID=UPI00074D4631|nr:ATPase [Ralstonia phage RSP15]BAU40056.1 NEDD4-binding protein [Ralstonia phage RSP15]
MMQIVSDVDDWDVPTTDEKPSLIIVRGIPGSGKSTFSRNLLDALIKNDIQAVHVESDMYHTRGNSYSWSPEQNQRAHEWCKTSADIFLDNKQTVIVSNTFTKYSEIRSYLQIAKNHDVPVLIVEIPVQRFNNVHSVPVATLERMRDNLEKNKSHHIVKHVNGEFPNLNICYVEHIPEIQND